MDILITEDLESPAIERLARKYSLVRDGALWREPQPLRDALGQARIVLVRNQTHLTGALLAAAAQLVGIGRVGVGLDNIDLAAASKLGVVVIAPLDANATSVAELTVGLMLALARRIPRADRSTKAGGWDRKGCTGVELAGKTVALCGLGRIGRRVAAAARALGMRCIAYDPFLKPDSPPVAETGATLFADLNGALAAADFVSAHLPVTAATRALFNADRFAAMRSGAYFINTSRGGVVDEAALVRALQNGQLAGAALDVREVEPPATGPGLEQLENVILTPHIGAFTREAQTRTLEAVCSNADRLLSGQPAQNFVNFPRPLTAGRPRSA